MLEFNNFRGMSVISSLFTILFFIGSHANAENHVKKLADAVKDINQELNLTDDDLPLNDPFAGQSAGSNRDLQIGNEEEEKDAI